MSLVRALLVCVEATCYQVASTPPNKTPQKGRYDARHPWYIKIATPVFKTQQPLVWLCAFSDLLIIFAQQTFFPIPTRASNLIQSTLCPSKTTIPLHAFSTSPAISGPNIVVTPSFVLGVFFVVLGTLIRLTCFRTLGSFFTFDLTIMPSHKLVTIGPYSYVRHPAYTGSLFIAGGLALVNLTLGGWVAECGILGSGTLGVAMRSLVFLIWYTWWVAVGIHRARSEDSELRKTFEKEWDRYAKEVHYWFVPGLL